MIQEFVEKNHYYFAETAADWKDAIRISCRCLEADGTVEPSYADEIIACVEKHGPYIVIIPGVAMPHSQEGAEGVNKTSIGFTVFEKPVSFEEGNPEMEAQLFFTLASCDPNQHLENMTRLTEVLMNEELLEALKGARTADDLMAISEKYE